MISWFEKHYIISWVFTVIIGALIFYLSSLTFAPGPGGGSNFNSIVYHIVAFFFFGIFLIISLVRGKWRGLVLVGFILAVLYGISDEFHQYFVPGRAASFGDVLLDTVGIIFAVMVYMISYEYRKRY